MKSLSKYFKVVLCFVAFALCSFMFAFTPTLTAVQAANMAITSYNVAINAIKMPTEVVDYENGDVFGIPLLESSMGDDTPDSYTIKVVDPSGYTHNYVVGGTNEDDFFGGEITATAEDKGLVEGKKYIKVDAKNDGDYKIMYVVADDDKTYYSNTYTVSVLNVSYELDFTTPEVNEVETGKYEIIGHTNNLIPSKMAKSNEKYRLPVAYAKAKGEELSIGSDGKVTNISTLKTDNKVSIKVTKNGAPQESNASGSIFGQDANGYYIIPSEDNSVITVEYCFEDSVNRPTKTFTINVEENFVAEDLTLASTPTMPAMELGKTITLPKLSVNAGDEKNVDVNITSIKIQKENNENIQYELTYNNLEFDFTKENFGAESYEDMVGNYVITYSIEDANGKTLNKNNTFRVTGVTVSSKPTIKLSYNYDVDATTGAYNKDAVVFGAETELKPEYKSVYDTTDGTKSATEFVVPAVYVEDAVTDNFNDFIIVRAIRKGSTYYYIDNIKYDAVDGIVELNTVDEDGKVADRYANYSKDENIGNPNKAVKFKFHEGVTSNQEGTYYLEYRVIAKNVKERENNLYLTGTNEKYSFKIVENLSETKLEDTTVEITNLKDSAVKKSDKISVNVTATDKLDTRLKTVVFTYTGADDAFETDLRAQIGTLYTNNGINLTKHVLDDDALLTALEAYKVHRAEETDTKNVFDLDLSKYNANDDVKVVAVTFKTVGATADIVLSETKTLTIKNTDDASVPSINIKAGDLPDRWKNGTDITTFEVGQGVDVELPNVYVDDGANGDKTLSLNVSYYIDSPINSFGGINYLSPVGKSYGYDNTIISGREVQVINGGKITTSAVGTYYVAYTATDVAGNTSVLYFTFTVKDTSNPILSVSPVADDATISGNTITGGKGMIVDFETGLKYSSGSELSDADKTTSSIDIKIDDNGKGLDFAPSGKGRNSYIFNDYGTYTVTISGEINEDRKADAKTYKVIIEKQEIKWLDEFDVQKYASEKEDVKLPDIAASNDAVVKVTYVAPGESSDSAKDAVKVVENGYSYWTFKTGENVKGTYKVTYTATTNEDVLTKTVEIKVGDNVAPTMTFNSGTLTQDFIYNGSKIEYIVTLDKKNKTFVVDVVNNGETVVSHNISLTLNDKDDGDNSSTSVSTLWSNLTFELTGEKVTKGDTTTSNNVTTTQYFIEKTGKYELKLTTKDGYDNTRSQSIKFNVVSKAEVKENKDNVVGAVLIVISLVLLAGVIVFFAFTGKKGGSKKANKTTKTKTTKSTKEVAEKVTETKVEEAEEATEEVEKVEDEAKSGDVE